MMMHRLEYVYQQPYVMPAQFDNQFQTAQSLNAQFMQNPQFVHDSYANQESYQYQQFVPNRLSQQMPP